MLGVVCILLGLFWIVFSKPLGIFAARYYEALRMPLMKSFEWGIMIIFLGSCACLFGLLVLAGLIPFRI